MNGYRFKEAGDSQRGVWTPHEEAVEAARRRTEQQSAAADALAQMEAKIASIRADATLTDGDKIRALRLLAPSGYSDAEARLLYDAQETG